MKKHYPTTAEMMADSIGVFPKVRYLPMPEKPLTIHDKECVYRKLKEARYYSPELPSSLVDDCTCGAIHLPAKP